MKKIIQKDMHEKAGDAIRALMPQMPEERSLSASLADHAVDIIKAFERKVPAKQLVDTLCGQYPAHARSSIETLVSRIWSNRESILRKHKKKTNEKDVAQPVPAGSKTSIGTPHETRNPASLEQTNMFPPMVQKAEPRRSEQDAN